MAGANRLGKKILLQYSVLILVLGVFNFYRYFSGGSWWSLVVAIICSIVFVGWILFYFLYVKGKEQV